jgi:hypothetical protein
MLPSNLDSRGVTEVNYEEDLDVTQKCGLLISGGFVVLSQHTTDCIHVTGIHATDWVHDSTQMIRGT